MPPTTPERNMEGEIIPEYRGWFLGCIGLVILLLTGFLLWHHRNSPLLSALLGSNGPVVEPISSNTYTCNEGKTIMAKFYEGSVSLVFSDGRARTLLQTISASGIRFANQDESLIFWSKGNTAFVQEGPNQDETYGGCVTASNIPGEEDWTIFASTTMAISLRYPDGYQVKTAYAYDDRGPKYTPIPGVKLLVPLGLWQGTNLSSDSGISVEELPAKETCSAHAFIDPLSKAKDQPFTDMGVQYLIASSSGAGAGNVYEEIVYTLPYSNPCVGIRYFIRSTNIGNYPPGSVEEYNRKQLLSDFDKIRESLVLGR